MSPDKAMIGYLQARIAELEAEVERLTAQDDKWERELAWSHERIRQLEGDIRAILKAGAEWFPWTALQDVYRELERKYGGSTRGVNPSGDTLGRKEREDG